MKCRGTNHLPPSIALWLEQQLELRGIDSVVYMRYILSLLNDESFDLSELTAFCKGNKKLSGWKSCNLEDLKRSAVIQCLTEAADQAFEIESLVDELCVKLKEANNEGDKCLKEKTNSEDIFNLDLPVTSLDLTNKYYSAFPALTKGNSLDNSFPLSSVWSRNFCRALGGVRRRGDSESNPKENKISKRKDNKENVLCGVNGGTRRMRSRSTVKQSSGHHYRNRASTAKSLDRKEDEISNAMKRTYGATKTLSGGDIGCGFVGGNTVSGSIGGNYCAGGDPRGRKCLNFMQNSLGQLIGYPLSQESTVEELMPRRREDKLSRTPGRKCIGANYGKGNDLPTTEYYDSAELPVDFQQLLTSPTDVSLESSLYKQQLNAPYTTASSGNFIQCGTNITSSIWSDRSEKMEEDDCGGISSGNWETVRGNTIGSTTSGGGGGSSSKWSDARGSILSSAWKLPFVYDKDVEGTSLAVNASFGSFYSFFDTNSIPTSLLAQNDKKDTEMGEKKLGAERNSGTLQTSEEQEEDLLTSMRTHFRPIRNNVDNSNVVNGPGTTGTSDATGGGNAVKASGGINYADGSTFTDSSASPVKLDYRRSESGALYLITTGEKYFEFKRSSPSTQTSSSFVPKFKVRQNEKFCQTESPLESDFFFPGDERLAEEMVNSCCEDDDDDEDVGETEESDEWCEGGSAVLNGESHPAAIQVSGWVTAWSVTMDSSADIWASRENSAKAWVSGNNDGEYKNIENGFTCVEDCRMDDRNEHYLRLKDELCEDGEELLSDLSSIHLFLDPERMDEPNPHLKKALTVESGGM